MAAHGRPVPGVTGSRRRWQPRRKIANGNAQLVLLMAVIASAWDRPCGWVAPSAYRAGKLGPPARRGQRGVRTAAAAGHTEGAAGEKGGEEKRGYQFGDLFLNKLTGKDKYEFGDLSRLVGGKIKEAACKVTGKDDYEFGDISRHLDAQAKEQVSKLTGKDTYEFGDISRYLDQQAKEQVANMTGKETYEFGDISKEIARRVQAGEVDFEDLYLLLRGVLVLGAGLLPVAHLLPVQLLLNFLDWSLQIDVTQRITSKVSNAVAAELDRRAKGTLLGEGNEDYVLGDFTRGQLQRAVKGITGKDTYEFGDISRAVLRNVQDGKKLPSGTGSG